MNKVPQWIPGPPGTGKTSEWLFNKYVECLKKGIRWDRIVVLSHTNVAALEIIKSVKKIPEMKDVSISKLEDQICTIHSYLRAEYINLKKYEKEDHDQFCKEHPEMKHWNKKQKWDKHPLYQIVSHTHGRKESFKDYWAKCDHKNYEPYSLKDLRKLKIKYENWRNDIKHKRLSFEDMIDNFRFRANCPNDIEVLIVDEAQDCSKPQIDALIKAATNAKEFIFIGDADQTIYEYSGADPDFFYKLSSTPEAKKAELKYGKRCGKTINTICKKIISPIWKKWGGNAERVWTPAEGVIGQSYWVPNIKQSCKAIDVLLDKIKNTNETFLFTYRGTPTDTHVSEFLKAHGIDFKYVSNENPHVSRKNFRCFKQWPNFINDKVSKKQITDFWPLIGKSVKIHGKGNVDVLKPLIDKEYNIQELIDLGFIKAEAKQYQSFSQVLTDKDLSLKVPFIKKVIANNFNTEEMPRVQQDCIHKVKGLTFDNIIVDLSTYREERNKDEATRLAYVAYSRGKKDCWSIGTSNFKYKSSLANIQNNRHYYLKEETQ